MGILGSVFDSFFDGLAIDILRNSNNKSPKPKKSQERQSVTSLKTWASHFDTSIDKDFTEYDWFDFYPSGNCNSKPSLHPKAFLSAYKCDSEQLTLNYLQLENRVILYPFDIEAQCSFIEYCFNLISLSAEVESKNFELEYDSQFAPSCFTMGDQLYEKIHRSIYNILLCKDKSIGGAARECTACILDAEVYLHKGELVKCLKRYYKALQYGILEKTTSYGFNRWNSLQCAVLSNIAGIYNFAGLNEESVRLFDKFQNCISERKQSCRELMNGCVRGSERNRQGWAEALNALNNPSSLDLQWTYFIGGFDEIGELYNVGNGEDGKGWPISLNFSNAMLLDFYENERGKQWAESQKSELKNYILSQC